MNTDRQKSNSLTLPPPNRRHFVKLPELFTSTLLQQYSKVEKKTVKFQCLARLEPKLAHCRVQARPCPFFNHTTHTVLICIICLILIHGEVNSIINILGLLSFVARYFSLFFSGPLFCNDFSLSFFSFSS